VNLAQVRRGLAWHYRANAREQVLADQQANATDENAAKAARKAMSGVPKLIPRGSSGGFGGQNRCRSARGHSFRTDRRHSSSVSCSSESA
jgi:hypothetical protein